MSSIFNGDDFGLKIYNRFPPKYREDDVGQNYALKRYLQSLSDGGFKYAIDEISGLTSIIDYSTVDAKVLPILFKQYGLEVFNGIPEEYLRYLLPRLGEAWSKKGSLSAIDFISSSIAGVKTSTEVTYDEQDNPNVAIRLEMDYTLGNYFPEVSQFLRLLENFVPFYCNLGILYSYFFQEQGYVKGVDTDHDIKVSDIHEESTNFSLWSHINENSSVFGRAVLGFAVMGVRDITADEVENNIVQEVQESTILTQPIDSFTNSGYNLLNGSFYTNAVYSYSVVTVGGNKEVLFI